MVEEKAKMDKSEFFIKRNEMVDIIVFEQVFKYKRPTADDELRWIEDYKEESIQKDPEGKEKIVYKNSLAKLAKCKLRNIMEVPFTREELKNITELDKEYKDYTDAEKDGLFGQLDPKIMNSIIAQVDNTRNNQKKS